MLRIRVFNAHHKYRVAVDETKSLVHFVLKSESVTSAEMNIIFTGDNEMKKLNAKFLNHKYSTDVLSFPLGNRHPDKLDGEVYINLDKARFQAKKYSVSFKNELSRLIIHGVLHLVGYKDKSAREKNQMVNLEELYLNNICRKDSLKY